MSEEPITPKTRFDPPQLWDDAAFRKRLAQLARKKGISVKQAMQEIGLTVEFAYRSADSRSTNMIMLVAEYFQVSPAELAGWVTPPGTVPKTDAKLASDKAELWRDVFKGAKPAFDKAELLTWAELFSQQTLKMLLITLAMSHTEMDPKKIAQLAALAKEDWQAIDGEKTTQNGS